MVEYHLCYEDHKTGHARDRNIFGDIVRAQLLRYADFVDMGNNALMDKSHTKVKVLMHFLLKKWCAVVWCQTQALRF